MSDEVSKRTMRVRIQNDGSHGYDTKITDAETGVEISQVAALTWTFDCNDKQFNGMPKALLTIFDPVVDIIVDAEIRHVCPVCGRDVVEGDTP